MAAKQWPGPHPGSMHVPGAADATQVQQVLPLVLTFTYSWLLLGWIENLHPHRSFLYRFYIPVIDQFFKRFHVSGCMVQANDSL